MIETVPGPGVRLVDATEPTTTWRDGLGQLWTMGEVTPDGNIVGRPGTFISAGIVYIDVAHLVDAVNAGWRQVSEIAPSGLTKVQRP